MENIILNAVTEIKKLIETAIIEGGVEGKNNLIRTQRPICILHDAAKSAFIKDSLSLRIRIFVLCQIMLERKMRFWILMEF